MARLERLFLNNNRLEALPPGAFLGLESLNTLWLRGNPGVPFGFPLEIVRTDGADPLSPGPARVALGLASGAPFAMELALKAHGGELSDSSSSVATGRGLGSEVTVTGTAGVQVVAAPPPAVPLERILGVEILPSEPLVLFAEATNLPPIARHEIQPQVLRIAGPGVRLNAADYFADPDGDELAYKAEVNRDDVLSLSFAGSMATLEPEAGRAAEAIVTFAATDPGGLSTELNFTVKILEPGAGTFPYRTPVGRQRVQRVAEAHHPGSCGAVDDGSRGYRTSGYPTRPDAEPELRGTGVQRGGRRHRRISRSSWQRGTFEAEPG